MNMDKALVSAIQWGTIALASGSAVGIGIAAGSKVRGDDSNPLLQASVIGGSLLVPAAIVYTMPKTVSGMGAAALGGVGIGLMTGIIGAIVGPELLGT